MKNYFLFVFLFVFIFQLSAQKSNDNVLSVEMVSKKWIFFDLINPEFTKEEYNETKEMLSDTSIEFRKDMTFTFSFIVDLDGTWTLEKNIISTEDRRGKNTWEIHEISENKITMSRNDAIQKIIFKIEE